MKINPKRTFVGVDTGFNHLIRPAMYGSYHEIINASKIEGTKIKADIVGNICESEMYLKRQENYLSKGG